MSAEQPTVLHREAAHPNYPGYKFTACGRIDMLGATVPQRLNTKTGYLRATLTDRFGRKRRLLVHRVLLEAFHGYASSNNPLACHLNDIKTDNRIENLYWGNRASNASDAVRNGRVGSETSGRTKLSRGDVSSIRSEYAKGGVTMQTLADRYGITQGHVCDICNGRKWRNVA